MRALGSAFSIDGRLRPQPFILTALAIYAAAAASQWLTGATAVAWGGLWPYAIVQLLLCWLWFVVHARRLRDAGRAVWPAAAVTALYLLSLVLLVVVAGKGALGLILLVAVIATLRGWAQHDSTPLFAALMTFMAFVPVMVAIVFTLWAATRPSARRDAAERNR